MKEIEAYVDGASKGNPGAGGWGAVLVYKNHRREIAGSVHLATNQQMELRAAIEALRALKEPCRVKLHSDSAYLVSGMSEWIKTWQAKQWRTSRGSPVANKKLWQELLMISKLHEITWEHTDDTNPMQARAHELASTAAQAQAAGAA